MTKTEAHNSPKFGEASEARRKSISVFEWSLSTAVAIVCGVSGGFIVGELYT